MKKLITLILTLTLVVCATFGAACGDNSKKIYVCASELPHADILQNCVADIVKEQGYVLEVKVLDWTLQNDSVASGDFDANYFQHVPYLETYEGSVELFASCKVHYEPLGIYQGKSSGALSEGKSFAICKDDSNAVRALNLLVAKGVISESEVPVENGKPSFENTWTSNSGVKITLIAEELLVASMPDYDFVCLPCNTALTGNVNSAKRVAFEDDSALVGKNANVLAARKNDYANDSEYKSKIDVLTDALLSETVAAYVQEKWGGAITCDKSSQIDLR